MTTTISEKKRSLFTSDSMFFGGVTGSVRLGYNVGMYICNDIQNAKKSVKICTPYISDAQLKEIFAGKLSPEGNQQEKQADAKIVYSLVITNGSLDWKYSNPADSLKTLKNNENFTIQVYKKRLHTEEQDNSNDYNNFLMLHAKFYIIDDEILYLSSSNFTKSGMEEGLEFFIRIKKNCGNDNNDFLIESVCELFQKMLEEHEKLGVNCHDLGPEEEVKAES